MNSDLPILNCDDCGACCLNIGHPMFFKKSDGKRLDQLPKNLRQELEEHIDNLEDADIGEPCIWYDFETKGCKHYEWRPQMCRDFELNSHHCRRIRIAQGIDPA